MFLQAPFTRPNRTGVTMKIFKLLLPVIVVIALTVLALSLVISEPYNKAEPAAQPEPTSTSNVLPQSKRGM